MATIRALRRDDFDAWLALYRLYADHYRVGLTEAGVAATWSWLMDDGHPVTGLVADSDGDPAGLVHDRAMPSPLRGHDIGFIDDLLVRPDARGAGVAETLIGSVRDRGREAGWKVVRWITRDDNYRARNVYDRLAVRTDWITYDMSCA